MNDRFAEYRWRERLLLEGGEPGFEERGPAPLFPVGDIETMGDFGVEAGGFAAIPVGKDGGEKLRSEDPVAPEEFFRRIDGMPMRKRETRRREMGRGS